MKKMRIFKVLSIVLCFMFAFSAMCNPISEVNAASKSSNMKKLCKRIKANDDMSESGYYYIYNTVNGDDMTAIYRKSSNKINVIYTTGTGLYAYFNYSASTKKVKVTVLSRDFETTAYVTVNSYNNKKSQVKISKVSLEYGAGCSKAYAKKKSIEVTRLAFLAMAICIYENTGMTLKDIGFKKFK